MFYDFVGIIKMGLIEMVRYFDEKWDVDGKRKIYGFGWFEGRDG